MTLSGNLGFVPLDEVLRLLTRSQNSGVVEITNGDVRGRIFVTGSGIGLATLFEDADLSGHLHNSGYFADNVEAGEFNHDAIALIRELTVESIYRLDGDQADFEVQKDALSPYAPREPFDLESVLNDSRARAHQWDEVRRSIPDLDAVLRINRQLPEDQVQLDRESWRLLSELNGGASVSDLSTRLGTTDFAVAQVAGAMVEGGLLSFEDSSTSYTPPSEFSGSFSTAETSDVLESTPSFDDAEQPQHEAQDPMPEPIAVADEPAEDTDSPDPDRSWWQEAEEAAVDTEDEPGSEDAVASSEAEVPEVPNDQFVPSGDLAVDADDDDDETEAFLEKVFSDVAADVPEEGHGLMRRRRMGSILRELGEE